MTPGEFKAWFDGFTEAFTGTPTKAQWERIKVRVAEIDGNPVTKRIYVDRYWPTYQRYMTPTFYHCSTTAGNVATGISGAITTSNTVAFNSSQAMADLGRAESFNLGAN